MKIISKYKDYYDYLKGIYGEDPLLILDRRESKRIKEFLCYNHISPIYLVIGNYKIDGFCYEKEFYWGKERLDYLENELNKNFSVHSKYLLHDTTHYIKIGNKRRWDYFYLNCNLRHFNNNTGFALYFKTNDVTSFYKYPLLEELGINKLIPAHQIWTILSDYLSSELTKREPLQPVGDDIVRLESAGFDKKTSFRNIK